MKKLFLVFCVFMSLFISACSTDPTPSLDPQQDAKVVRDYITEGEYDAAFQFALDAKAAYEENNETAKRNTFLVDLGVYYYQLPDNVKADLGVDFVNMILTGVQDGSLLEKANQLFSK